MKKYLFFLKIFISIVLLLYVFNTINISAVADAFHKTNFLFLFLAFTLYFIALVLMVLKWEIVLRCFIKVKRINLFFIYWGSDFINLFSIGSVGSEVYKMVSFNDKKKALFTSLFDKFISLLLFLAILVSISLPLYILQFENKKFSSILVICLFCSLFFSTYLLINKFKSFRCFPRKINQILQPLNIDFFSFVVHSLITIKTIIIEALIYFLIFYSLGISANLLTLFILIIFLKIAVTLPITYEGLGIRELLLIEYAKMQSINIEEALLVSLIAFSLVLIYRITGVFPFLFIKTKKQ